MDQKQELVGSDVALPMGRATKADNLPLVG